jgi:bifunctional non-homologous end joining protein LigD
VLKKLPTVSTPVSWDEVEAFVARKKPDAWHFEASDIPSRIKRFGDLFKPVITLQQKLPRFQKALSR